MLIDFSASLISPQSIKNAGYKGVIGYFSDSRPGSNFGAKPLRKDYCDKLRAAGLEIVTNYQYGKDQTSDWKGGYDAGVYHAKIALAYHFAAGGPAYRPLYAPVDSNPTLEEWNTQIAPFLRGWASVVGLEWTGVYCNARCIDWALEDGVAKWFWQHNWSGDPKINGDHPAAHMHQIRIDEDSVAGIGIDVNTILKDDYGQWSKAPAQPPPPKEEPAVSKPEYTEIDMMGKAASSRGGQRITNFLLHTQQGNGTAQNLANYCNNTANQVSYHYTCRDGILVDVVDTDLASWSVGNANGRTINFCFAGSFAEWSRAQWLEREHDIRIAAWIAVQDSKKYGASTDVIGRDYSRERDGISDHEYVTRVIGWGSHTDCGPNFPWDRLKAFVAEYVNGVVAPPAKVANAIDDKAAQATWLGARLTIGENACADGVGRYARFANGYIYWHPKTGAHPIPNALFDEYMDLGWETGVLGYPTLDHATLEGGIAQAFQKGGLYRQDGNDPYAVRGAIGAEWAKAGFEKSSLGWPTSDELLYGTDGRKQTFEHGAIYWVPKPTNTLIIPK